MRRLFASFFMLALLSGTPAFAVMEDYPSVKLQGLDKSVGRTTTFEAKVGSTIQYGPLFIKIDSCRKAPPIEKPESAAFLQIWEVPPGADKSEWKFSGWMFASSPALSAMDHPVYDVWVLDCLGKEQPNEEAKQAETDEQADQTGLPAPEATTPDTSAPQVQEQTAPEQEAPIPTDSEAESDSGSTVEENPSVVPDAAQTPATDPISQGEQPSPADPATDDKGVTAYDFMKRGAGAGH